jgi:cholesterol transport system auxiliary component
MRAGVVSKIVGGLLVLALAGCGFGSSSSRPNGLFDLGPSPAPSQQQASSPKRGPLSLGFTATQMLGDTGVIWRVGDSASPHSYATYRWASAPVQLVQQRVVDMLSLQGPVMTDSIDPTASVLQISLMRFEQVYAPDGKSSEGKVEMQAVLLRERRAVDSVRLVRSAPAQTQDAEGGVLALRAATDQAIDDLDAWLAQRMPPPGSPAANAGPHDGNPRQR